jgi:hypothetical protein
MRINSEENAERQRGNMRESGRLNAGIPQHFGRESCFFDPFPLPFPLLQRGNLWEFHLREPKISARGIPARHLYIEGMAQTMEEQADALYPEAQAVSQTSSISPFRVVSSALRSGLLSVQRDNNREMNRIVQSIELCKQHVCNQADYIRRIDDAVKKGSDSLVLQNRKLSSMVVSITDQGRSIQAVTDSMLELLTLARTADTAIRGQTTQLTNLEAQLRSFDERVFAIPEQEELQAERDELSPEAEAAQLSM